MVLPDWMRLALCLLAVFAAAAISTLYIGNHTFSWFLSLHKPALFSPSVNSLLFVAGATYILMACASSIMWIMDHRPHDFRGWMPLFLAHLLVNAGWMILFFGYHVLFVSLIVAFILAVYVFLIVCGTWERSRIAFFFLLPYLVWVLYALGMNMAFWLAN